MIIINNIIKNLDMNKNSMENPRKKKRKKEQIKIILRKKKAITINTTKTNKTKDLKNFKRKKWLDNLTEIKGTFRKNMIETDKGIPYKKKDFLKN